MKHRVALAWRRKQPLEISEPPRYNLPLALALGVSDQSGFGLALRREACGAQGTWSTRSTWRASEHRSCTEGGTGRRGACARCVQRYLTLGMCGSRPRWVLRECLRVCVSLQGVPSSPVPRPPIPRWCRDMHPHERACVCVCVQSRCVARVSLFELSLGEASREARAAEEMEGGPHDGAPRREIARP